MEEEKLMEKFWLAQMNANVQGRTRGKMRAGSCFQTRRLLRQGVSPELYPPVVLRTSSFHPRCIYSQPTPRTMTALEC